MLVLAYLSREKRKGCKFPRRRACVSGQAMSRRCLRSLAVARAVPGTGTGRAGRLLKQQTTQTHPGQERSSSVPGMRFVAQGTAMLRIRKSSCRSNGDTGSIQCSPAGPSLSMRPVPPLVFCTEADLSLSDGVMCLRVKKTSLSPTSRCRVLVWKRVVGRETPPGAPAG